MKALFRTDASPQMGTGHVMRCIALLQVWQSSAGEGAFLVSPETAFLDDRLLSERAEVFYLPQQPGSFEDAHYTAELARKVEADWVIVDGYHFDDQYQKVIKDAGLKLLFLDDYGHTEHYYADLVLNQNIYAQPSLYKHLGANTQLLLGSSFVVLRRDFWPWRDWTRSVPEVATNVLVTLGGSDPPNATLKVIQALQETAAPLKAIVIVGSSNPYYEQLQAAVNSSTNIELQRNVLDMPSLIAWADVAVAAGGTTSWELAFMGLPSATIVLAENQYKVAEALQEQGIAINLGWHNGLTPKTITEAIEWLINGYGLRAEMAAKSRSLIDGQGGERVLKRLLEESLRLRPARGEDAELVWNWVNDSETRANSFSPDPIPWKDHTAWFSEKLQQPNYHFYIAVDGQGREVGYVRFAIAPKNAIISIALDKRFRGKGLGSKLIELSCSRFFQETTAETIEALIKPQNMASIKSFIKAGFRDSEAVRVSASDPVKLVKHRQH